MQIYIQHDLQSVDFGVPAAFGMIIKWIPKLLVMVNYVADVTSFTLDTKVM